MAKNEKQARYDPSFAFAGEFVLPYIVLCICLLGHNYVGHIVKVYDRSLFLHLFAQ
jgi:hypothetical protein